MLLYPILLLVTFILCLCVGSWIYRTRSDRTTFFFFLLTASTGLWTGLILLEMIVLPQYATTLFYLHRAVAWATPIIWVVFALYYTGKESRLTRPVSGVLFGSYGVAIALLATNPAHNLLWTEITITQSNSLNFIIVDRSLAYSFVEGGILLYTVLGLGVFAFTSLTTRRISREQLLVLIGGASFATVFSFFEPQFIPISSFDDPVISTGLFYTFIGVGLFQFDLFDVGPIARDVAFDAVTEAVVVLNETGQITDYNEAAEDMFTDLEGSVGESLSTVLPELIDEETVTNDSDSEDSITIDSFVNQFTHYVEDDRREYIVRANPIYVGESKHGYTVLITDVTEMKAYARRLEQQTEQHEEFARFVSHGLRNPMTVALTYLYKESTETKSENIETAIDSLERMEDIVEDALAFARKGQAIGDRDLEPLTEIASRAGKAVTLNNSEVVITCSESTYVYTDAPRLQTVFENMFENAVKHSSTDVTIRVGVLESRNGFYVEDDGPGIPPVDREKIFNEGFTTDDDLRMGFGLATVQSIVRGHDWDLVVTDSENGGARFEITGAKIVDKTQVEGDPTNPGSVDVESVEIESKTI